tara:strand:+ start:29 stop:739 length:711 start_codon:yes stop_codon:yes gene_type:complete
MVNIDTVYQRVLAFANKEQRGYITPQEFNLFANQAQIEIYEQYHYDVNNFEMRDATYTLNSDTTDLTRQKLDVFIEIANPGIVGGYSVAVDAVILPSEVYRLSRVEVLGVKAEYMDTNRFMDVTTSGPLVRASASRPVYTEHKNRIRVDNGSSVISNIGIHYYRLPATVSWGYFVMSGKALYDSSDAKTTHFELHSAEESELVYRILAFAGVSMQKPNLSQAAGSFEAAKVTNEKQ